MTRDYRLGLVRRAANAVIKRLTRFGLAGRHTYLLTVRGRKSGSACSTPVTLIENGDRWLVAPYGEVSWVKNVRTSGEVSLSRSGRTEVLRAVPASVQEAAPILKRYLADVAVVRPYFDATASSPTEAFEAEADHHPVFKLVPPA